VAASPDRSAAQDRSAEIKAHLDASPERVWAALTGAEALTAWYWPASTEPKASSTPTIGGRFSITTPDAAMGFSGEYLELDPPRRIVQSWRWAGEQTDSRVTIELTPSGGGTDLVVLHDRLDAETAELYRRGWESCLVRLPAYLA
jgi:uncharacterized protein YndB with AHSA1/START domain